MFNRRLAATLGTLALVLAACTGTGDGSAEPDASEAAESQAAESQAAASAGAGGDCIVGVSWNNYQEERWALRDEPAIQAALEEAGAEYISADAGSSEEQQASDVENLLSQGANVIIILAQNTETILPSVQAARDRRDALVARRRQRAVGIVREPRIGEPGRKVSANY